MSTQDARATRKPLRPCEYPTVERAADDCGVSTETVRRWIREGRLAAIRVGPRRLRIDPESLAQMVQPR